MTIIKNLQIYQVELKISPDNLCLLIIMIH